jgi:hypothetical protein
MEALSNAQPLPGSILSGASNFSIEGSTFIAVGGDMHYVVSNNIIADSKPGSNINNVLRCPPPIQDFVGREDVLEKLSKNFAAPVISVTCEKTDLMKDLVAKVRKWSGCVFEIFCTAEDKIQ